jgi:hypothetical protein
MSVRIDPMPDVDPAIWVADGATFPVLVAAAELSAVAGPPVDVAGAAFCEAKAWALLGMPIGLGVGAGAGAGPGPVSAVWAPPGEGPAGAAVTPGLTPSTAGKPMLVCAGPPLNCATSWASVVGEGAPLGPVNWLNCELRAAIWLELGPAGPSPATVTGEVAVATPLRSPGGTPREAGPAFPVKSSCD